MEYFIVLTVQVPLRSGGFSIRTVSEVVTVTHPDATRAGLFQWAFNRLPEHDRKGNVLFFAAEPNRLNHSRSDKVA